MRTIDIFDTSLRDGAQARGVSFSLQDKLAVVRSLDELGVRWIEAGNPASNPKDADFFREVKKLRAENAAVCAFGATVKKGATPAADPGLQKLLGAETAAVVIFGKSSLFHARDILGVSPEENLAMIAETVRFLREHGRLVIYDAEHFFDARREDAAYALATVEAALDAGASTAVLCDTNGGSFPEDITQGVAALKARCPGAEIGIHAHNDAGLAVACSLAAVGAGCAHVQGTLTGFGERCGNTALAALIPSLELKLGCRCLPEGRLQKLREISRTIAEIANMALPESMPYVGSAAFAHKAGMHADAILKARASFEHIDPALVGNGREFLMSEVGGRAAIAERLRKLDPSVTKSSPVVAAVSRRLKELEAGGSQFEGADASFEILALREMGRAASFFKIVSYRVTSEHPPAADPAEIKCCYAWIKVLVKGRYEIAGAEGDGPVNALDLALRRALSAFYPELSAVRLSDYKVRVINGKDATAARVRVLVESTDGKNTWTTLGVSSDIIDASRFALIDAIEYKLTTCRGGVTGAA
ncbi:MAG: citramalate synthase [Spirochaetaceae bacterium]|jgi:2-isopropylmalate synthase|nr:citramalate synthase [Spirochaetaceae bacterium]